MSKYWICDLKKKFWLESFLKSKNNKKTKSKKTVEEKIFKILTLRFNFSKKFLIRSSAKVRISCNSYYIENLHNRAEFSQKKSSKRDSGFPVSFTPPVNLHFYLFISHLQIKRNKKETIIKDTLWQKIVIPYYIK